MEFKYLIAPIVTTIGILVSLILWLITFRRKEMSYEVLYDTPVLGVHDQMTERMHIVYGDDTVDNVYLIMVKVSNSGNVAVRAKDFDGKLAIQLPAASRVLNAGVAESNPSNLNERSLKDGVSSQDLIDSFGDARVDLRPVLLNKGDFITVKMLASRAEGPIAVSGHIEGIPSIKPQKDRSTFAFITANVGCVLMIAAVIFLDPNYIAKHLFKEGLPDVVLFLLGYGLLYTAIIMPRRRPRVLPQMNQPNG
jgi:hypothetical protein